MKSIFLIFLLFIFTVTFSLCDNHQDSQSYNNIADFTQNFFISFFKATSYPDLEDCVTNAHDSLINFLDASNFLFNTDEKDLYMGLVKLMMAATSLMQEIRVCNNISEPFKEIYESLSRFDNFFEYFEHIRSNFLWSTFDIARCSNSAYKAWGFTNFYIYS